MAPEPQPPVAPARKPVWTVMLRAIGFLLMVPVALLYVSSGLIVPTPYLFVLWALWGAFLVVMIVKRHDWHIVLASPFVALALWFAILWAGGTFLGWTA